MADLVGRCDSSLTFSLVKFRKEIRGIKYNKASVISYKCVNELIQNQIGKKEITNNIAEAINRVLADEGYAPKKRGYVNSVAFGWKKAE